MVKKTEEYQAKISVDGRIWINIGDKSFLGHGRIELIEKIKEYGSLSQAAGKMNLSYRKAWDSINKANLLAGKPLVILKRGGKEGGNAEITEFGEKAILLFNKLHQDFIKFLNDKTNSIEF